MPQPQLLVCVQEKPALSPVSATPRSERRSRCTCLSSSAPALGAAASPRLPRVRAFFQGLATGKCLTAVQGTASALQRSGDIPWERQRVLWSRPGASRTCESNRGRPPGRRRPGSLAACPGRGPGASEADPKPGVPCTFSKRLQGDLPRAPGSRAAPQSLSLSGICPCLLDLSRATGGGGTVPAAALTQFQAPPPWMDQLLERAVSSQSCSEHGREPGCSLFSQTHLNVTLCAGWCEAGAQRGTAV